MSDCPLDPYQYEDLPTQASFRVIELLPGEDGDTVSCSLHLTNWSHPLEYEAISYAWGDANLKASVTCDGKRLDITQNLYTGLTHLRFQNRSRFLWADALCINQSNSPERGLQVNHMRKIYQDAKTVLIWLGPDTQEPQAEATIDSIIIISDFLCRKLGISLSDLSSMDNTCQKLVLQNRNILPPPNECDFSTDAMWKSLVWFYSHPYFSRGWVIQEIASNTDRLVHCGHAKTEWDRIDLVASYIIMEPTFSKGFNFSSTYCWWAASVTELARQTKDWLGMLYLASNFSCLDGRDVIYSLRGLIEISKGAGILDPDYTKSTVEVYRDSVEAAFLHFRNTNVLLYITGNDTPSWIPRWDRPMLFRNPFRFGRAVPWKPAGETGPVWNIDKELNALSLSGFTVDTIKSVESYNESFFGDDIIKSRGGRDELRQVWQKILKTMEISQSHTPFSINTLAAAAMSFSFGLDERTEPAAERHLIHSFVAYLKIVLDKETYNKYIPADVSEESGHADGHTFGKPVWDFKYPESSFFITEGRLMGCSISETMLGDMVCVALGSTYPYILRPNGDHFLIKGYSYVHGIMHGEQQNSERQVFRIL